MGIYDDSLAAFNEISSPSRRLFTQLKKMCLICGSISRPFDVVDFFKCCNANDPYVFGFSGIPVTYYRCENCMFIFTDFCEGWQPHHFKEYIYNNEYIKVDPDYIKRRPENIAFPRQVAMFLSRQMTETSLSAIGDAFGGRDHGTVLHACRLVKDRMEADPNVRQVVNYLEKALLR